MMHAGLWVAFGVILLGIVVGAIRLGTCDDKVVRITSLTLMPAYIFAAVAVWCAL